ncbi:MAG: methyltransferase domain-containing protein [Pyrinomonadaceae bacterium]|nr:methyltransferase domain-containing protein [Pyrinomonadaceae bacterium]
MSEKETLTVEYFENVYAAAADPWNFATSPYEAEKYRATLAALTREKYSDVFEIGCSIGVLTEKLAVRCERLLSIDVSERALAQARRRCADLPNVTFKKMSVPQEFPVKKFDLVLISEVGYYLSEIDWLSAMEKVFGHLTEKGQIVLVHWRPVVDDYPQTGDRVHASFARFAREKLRRLNQKLTEKYRLDVWEKL